MPTYAVKCQDCGHVFYTGPETVREGGVCPKCGFRHAPGKLQYAQDPAAAPANERPARRDARRTLPL